MASLITIDINPDGHHEQYTCDYITIENEMLCMWKNGKIIRQITPYPSDKMKITTQQG